MKFRAIDYKDYNEKLGLLNYGYLHRLLDLLYKLRKQYKLKDERLYYWSGDEEEQAEVLDTMYFDINDRIAIHKKIFQDLWQKRHVHIIKQLRLF